MIRSMKGWSPDQSGVGADAAFPPSLAASQTPAELTHSIGNFAENYFERFCVTLCEGIYHHILW